MTIVVVLLLGAGVLFVASALDNTPIITTFQKIISGQHVNWSGQSGDASLPPGTTVTPAATGCPTGWTKQTSVSGVTFGKSWACVPPQGSSTNKCPTGYTSETIGGIFVCIPASTTVN
jgi:hypothetical protein